MARKQTRHFGRPSFEVRSNADGTVGVAGFASVFDQVAYGEVIRSGAFTETLKQTRTLSCSSITAGCRSRRPHARGR